MKKCSFCEKKDAISKIKWIGKQSVKTTSYPCTDCFIRIGKELKNAEEYNQKIKKSKRVVEILDQMEKEGEFDGLTDDEKEVQRQIIGMRMRSELEGK